MKNTKRDWRQEEVDGLVAALRAAIQPSALTYTAPVARTTAAFIADPTSETMTNMMRAAVELVDATISMGSK